MNKSIIIAAAALPLLIVAPGFAQDSRRCESNGATTGQGAYHGPASGVVRGGEQRDEAAAKVFHGQIDTLDYVRDGTRRPGFEGPHGSATNLRDTPSSDPTERGNGATAGHVKVFNGNTVHIDSAAPAPSETDGATLYGRKTGGRGNDAAAEPRPPRAQQQNNLKQIGLANSCN